MELLLNLSSKQERPPYSYKVFNKTTNTKQEDEGKGISIGNQNMNNR